MHSNYHSANAPRAVWLAFLALSLAANLPTLANASLAAHPLLAACIAAQGVTLYLAALALLRPRAALLLYGLLLLLLFPLNAICIVGTASPLSYGIISALVKTTPAEAFAQVKTHLGAIALFLAAIAAYFLVLFRRIPPTFKLSPSTRLFAPLAAIYCTLTIASIAAIPYAERNELTRQTATQEVTDKAFRLLFPLRDAKLITDYLRDELEMAESLAKRHAFPDSLFYRLPGFDTATIGILSIGETARACRWQLAGFHRNTNPRLSQRENLFFYADAYCGANLTEFSAPMYFSNDRPQNIRTWKTSPILNEIFKALGIATGLVSSQGYRSKWRASSFIHLASSANESRLITTHGAEPHVHDEQLIAPTLEIIARLRAPLFITFWGYGGHHWYRDRYPAKDAHFSPDKGKRKENELNAFDNTTLHTDRVHDSLIAILEATGKPAFLIYAADHGETLFDIDNQNHYHGTAFFSHGEAHVPCFVWLSRQYILRHPRIADALASNLAKPIQTTALFHTAQHLMHAAGPNFDSTLSLASRSYALPTPREGLNANRELIPPPPYDSLERLRIDSATVRQLRRHRHLLR